MVDIQVEVDQADIPAEEAEGHLTQPTWVRIKTCMEVTIQLDSEECTEETIRPIMEEAEVNS